MTSERILQLIILLVFAFSVNLPLGYLRETSQKFSLRWFLLIHVSIPFIIALRVIQGFDWHFLPLTLGCAVAGQVLGGKLRRRKTP
ncbi:MAG: hypothetical protein C0619_13345 [Desulfuromonas sp.]|nr:MAG: hypothetical protein C0619_13345 [Desulfuromonas sp.]